MKRTLSWAFALGLMWSPVLLQAAQPQTGRLSIDKHHIKVWTYQTPQNPVASYKAETTFNVPLERAVALILDVEHAHQWVPYMGKIKILSRDEQAGEYLLYVVMDLPFPLKDRDMIIKSKVSRDSKGVVSIRNRGLDDNRLSQSDYVRLKDYQGDWTFQSLGPDTVKVSTMGYVNPEGSLPISFMNMFVEQQPYQMLKKMKTQLDTPQTFGPLPKVLK